MHPDSMYAIMENNAPLDPADVQIGGAALLLQGVGRIMGVVTVDHLHVDESNVAHVRVRWHAPTHHAGGQPQAIRLQDGACLYRVPG